jgi:hypothetical protein
MTGKGSSTTQLFGPRSHESRFNFEQLRSLMHGTVARQLLPTLTDLVVGRRWIKCMLRARGKSAASAGSWDFFALVRLWVLRAVTCRTVGPGVGPQGYWNDKRERWGRIGMVIDSAIYYIRECRLWSGPSGRSSPSRESGLKIH